MEERKFIGVRKDEFSIKEFIKKEFGKGKVSNVKIEYTPVGEKIIVSTHKPGLIIGKRGESIERLTIVLKKKFKMENPHVDIFEIKHPEFDSQLVADEIALSLERFGSLRFKAIAYKILTKIKNAGALGAELRLSGKLPSERARTWRFAYGYLKKTGDMANAVDRSESVATTPLGVVGIKVAILSPETKLDDAIDLGPEFLEIVKKNMAFVEDEKSKKKTKRSKKE